MPRKDLVIAPLLESVLILAAALAAWLLHQPLVFASLGPTAFEIIETPDRPSARPYNIIVGNLIAIGATYAALVLTDAWHAPPASLHGIPLRRVWATALAAMLTVFGTLLTRATQPAALSTALLISLGILPRLLDGVLIMAAVILITLLGQPMRRWRANAGTVAEKQPASQPQ